MAMSLTQVYLKFLRNRLQQSTVRLNTVTMNRLQERNEISFKFIQTRILCLAGNEQIHLYEPH